MEPQPPGRCPCRCPFLCESGSGYYPDQYLRCSPLKLAKVGLGESLLEINRQGARISKQAAGDQALVFASIGRPANSWPLGNDPRSGHGERLCGAGQGPRRRGADGIVVETMMDLAEAKAALRAAKENTSLPVAVT